MESLDAAYAEIHRDHPFLEPPDFVASVRNVLNLLVFKSILDPHNSKSITTKILTSLLVCTLLFVASCKTGDYSANKIIAMEKAALDRWGKEDPHGYMEIMDEDLTYFHPFQEKRLDGLGAMKDFIKPFTGKIKVNRFDIVNPKVQRKGNIALLTFNLLSYVKQPDGTERSSRGGIQVRCIETPAASGRSSTRIGHMSNQRVRKCRNWSSDLLLATISGTR